MKKTLLVIIILLPSIFSYCQSDCSLRLDSLFKFYQKQNLFNGSVLISKKGKVLLNNGYGYENASLGIKSSPESIYQIYSVTKTFTSTVILKLIEENRLSLSDKLSKFYPGFPKGDSITIENLLTHTSGVYDYTRGNDMKDQSEKTFVEFLKTKPLDFPVGSDWSYSNSGYYFLGYIIQKVTGVSYEGAVSEYIFKPLQMDKSGFAFKNLKSERKAVGYEVFSNKTKRPSIIYEPPGPFSAGGIYSTVEDLYKYYEGLNTYRILSESSLDKAYKPFKNFYGYGWVIIEMFGKKTVGHSGAGAGFRSNFVQIPEDDICIVLLSNTENDINNITGGVLKLFYDKGFRIPNEVKVTKTKLAQFIGTFEVNRDFFIYVYLEGDKLICQPSRQPKSILYPEKDNSFYAFELGSFISFKRNKENIIDTLVFDQNGQTIKAKKIFPTWEIVGTATENGWEGVGLELVKTGKKEIWEIDNIRLKDGEIKFRFNSDWTINLGAKDITGTLKQDGDNIKIQNGDYNIRLDLTDSENPIYEIRRQK